MEAERADSLLSRTDPLRNYFEAGRPTFLVAIGPLGRGAMTRPR